jgi:hypothetical protein
MNGVKKKGEKMNDLYNDIIKIGAKGEEMAEVKTQLEEVLEKFKALKEESKVDTAFDKTTIDATGFNITMNKTKWITKKCEWDYVYRQFELKRKKSYVKLHDFYEFESNNKLSTKADYDLFIESNDQYVDINNICLTIKSLIIFIDGTIDNLKTKGFEVKAFIEWQQFKNGR